MKIYINEEGITLVGKAWEIVQKLKEYNKDYVLVSDWVRDVSPKK
ncbi:Z-ring formation inhibitor MciZ [Neobacillus cucumis]|nr:Z-ring formation inhibitor MciZ [Neobacillus cucumis]MDR4948478.1 Z-ring formation inhibitor MciZ [Neobacillus cucumis]